MARERRHRRVRIRRTTGSTFRSSTGNPVMILRGRSCRFDHRPRTIATGQEVVRLYAAGRALEDRREWTDAVAVLQEALKLEPDSIAVARRLCRLYIGALSRPDLAVEYGKRVLKAEPGDSETLSQLVEYYRRDQPAAAESILNEVLANPKLEAHAFGRLLAQSELGRLYSGPAASDGKGRGRLCEGGGAA